MAVYASRPLFSLDFLIGEAKHRMRRRRLLILVAILIGSAATAAAIELSQRAYAENPFAIRRGMTVQQVRAVAGLPNHTNKTRLGEYARIRARDLTGGRVVRTEKCWSYYATKTGTAVDGVFACFFRGRVLDVGQDVHG